VKLISSNFIKSFVGINKNDSNDAETIADNLVGELPGW